MTSPTDYAYPVAPGDVPYWQPGMELRDFFAAQVLTNSLTANLSAPELAGRAYEIADAMMARRGKR